MIKLIVTDLDGTLLKDDHQVPERFWTIADRLFQQGTKLAIATGRPQFSIAEKFKSILHNLYAISDNGSLITHDRAELMSKPLPQYEIEALINVARAIPQAWPILCGKEKWYVEDTDAAFAEKVSVYHENFSIVDDLTKVEDAILKMTVCDLAGAQENSFLHYKPFENRLKIATGGAVWLDITDAHANKGEAVKALQQLNNISADETLVFGDFMNDYEMMQAATYSYAMKNAYPAILEVANFITAKDNNEEGILDVIEALCFN